MGRDKRKTRLDKGEAGEFIGFAAFAAPAAAAAAVPPAATPAAATGTATAAHAVARGGGGGGTGGSSLALSPVYMGTDMTLKSVIFPKIGQKRDATTKAKALTELKDFLSNEQVPKKVQVDALGHFLYLYHSKLHYDNTSKVRSVALECCSVACRRLPKAWKALCYQDKTELLGMMMCSLADQAADVRLAANQLIDSWNQDNQQQQQQNKNKMKNDNDNNNDEDDDSSAKSIAVGVWDYVERILSYGKPIAMYEELFQKGRGGNTNNATSSTTSLTEQQKEELDERYERIVGTALAGLTLYIQKYPNHIVPQLSDDGSGDVRFLWKTLSNQKASLRRKTYSLLSMICQMKKSSIIDPNKIMKQLVQTLNVEKDHSNIPTLLQTLLSFMVNIIPTKEERANTMSMFAKPLMKMFKKGCYGANEWSPMVLPLIVMLPSNVQPTALTSVWEGRSHMVGIADDLSLVMAVAETATYLLVQSSSSSSSQASHGLTEIFSKCWLRSLQVYLTCGVGNKNNKPLVGPAKIAHEKLKKSLVNDWMKLHQASMIVIDNETYDESDVNHTGMINKRPHDTAIFHMKESFWNTELSTILLQVAINENNKNNNLLVHHYLAAFFTELSIRQKQQQEQQEQSKNISSESYQDSILKQLFFVLLKQYQNQKNNLILPTSDMYRLWLAILQLVPTVFTYDDNNDDDDDEKNESEDEDDDDNNNYNDNAKKFIMNDLLRWMIIYSSTLSDHVDTTMIEYNFHLYQMICQQNPNQMKEQQEQKHLILLYWDTILRELIAAKCDLQCLIVGIGIVLQKSLSSSSSSSSSIILEQIRSPIIEKLCSDIVKEVVEPLPVTNTLSSSHRQHKQNDNDNEKEQAKDATDEDDDDDYSDDDDDHHEEALTEYHRKISEFLQTCVGLNEINSTLSTSTSSTSSPMTVMLVNESTVIKSWIEMACPHDVMIEMIDNPVLETLILLVKKTFEDGSIDMNNNNNHVLSEKDSNRIVLQAWRQGGGLWHDMVLPWLLLSSEGTNNDDRNENSTSSLTGRIISLASTELQATLKGLLLILSDDRNRSTVWSNRAFRLISMCNKYNNHHNNDNIPSPSLQMVGLADVGTIWNKSQIYGSKSFAARCLMKLLSKFDTTQERWNLITNIRFDDKNNNNEDNDHDDGHDDDTMKKQNKMMICQLLVQIFICLTDAGNNPLSSNIVQQQGQQGQSEHRTVNDTCTIFLQQMFGTRRNKIDRSIVEGCSKECMIILSSLLQQQREEAATSDKEKSYATITTKKKKSKIIAILSLLANIQFNPLRKEYHHHHNSLDGIPSESESNDNLILNQLKKGDVVWYIRDANKPIESRTRCTIVKIHTDLPQELYFTIKIETKDENGKKIIQERQTVGSRLRSTSGKDDNDGVDDDDDDDDDEWTSQQKYVTVESLDGNEIHQRQTLVQDLVDKIILPLSKHNHMNNNNNDNDDNKFSVDYELFNVAISQYGLPIERGLGSMHFSILQQLLTLQSNLRGLLLPKPPSSSSDEVTEKKTKNKNQIVTTLWQLSLALGYGCNTASTMWGIALMDFDPTDSITAICEHYTGSSSVTTNNGNGNGNDSDKNNKNKSIEGDDGNNADGADVDDNENDVIILDLMDAEVDMAALAWLSVSSAHLKDKMKQAEAYSLAFRLVTRLLDVESTDGEYNRHCSIIGDDDNDNDNDNSHDKFGLDDYIAIRAMNSIQVHSHKAAAGTSLEQDFEAEALVAMTKALASRWENNSKEEEENNNDIDSLSVPLWRRLSYTNAVIKSSFGNRKQLMAAASRQCIDELTKCIFVDCKRWIAMQYLTAYANQSVPLHSDPTKAINPITAKRLEGWYEGLVEEEMEELEDDVGAVAQWTPKSMMNMIETWYSESEDRINNNTKTNFIAMEQPTVAYGRMCMWLSFLQLVDTASAKDSFNRPAMTSYITKCRAVDYILHLAMSFGNIGTDRKVKLDEVLELDQIITDESTSSFTNITKLAALTVFRTVEVFPTLSKHWWEMSCPNYWTQPLRDFVERHVSPNILNRELRRIQIATAFGEMKVKGSSVSREITATYVQDDFTLSVVIKLPLSFPFRRAEVDCSKTLGVSESRWKRWSLQITQMMNNQGGTLKDALLLWKENVDKEFEGVEPCPVCYSVLHVKTHKLPTLQCKTCGNRFHFECLTQWFRSSGKNVCVICQQPWSGIRVQT